MFFYEAKWINPNKKFCFLPFDHLDFPNHFHRNFELIYVTDGDAEIMIDGHRLVLSRKEAFLVLPNQHHAYISNKEKEQSRGMIFIFSPDEVGGFDKLIKDKRQKTLSGIALGENLASSLESWPQSEHDEFETKAVLYGICSEFYRKTEYIEFDQHTEYMLTHKIISMIQDEYLNDISLEEVSRCLGYNYHYLSRIIAKYFNMNFMTIKNQYRISHALELLKAENATMTEIAFVCGYGSIRTFNRNFFNIVGMSPSQYMRKAASVKDMEYF